MNSIFDILGPVMIGPSSSHTAGAARLAKMARYILHDVPKEVTMTLYGSFAKTYKGHGTDKALIAGLLGFDADDERIPRAYEEAKERGLEIHFTTSEADGGHPNVVKFSMLGEEGRTAVVEGRSLGGGRILITEIGGVPVEITGEKPTLLTFHNDQPGVVAAVTEIMATEDVNIISMRVFGDESVEAAVMNIEMDKILSKEALEKICSIEAIQAVMNFDPI